MLSLPRKRRAAHPTPQGAGGPECPRRLSSRLRAPLAALAGVRALVLGDEWRAPLHARLIARVSWWTYRLGREPWDRDRSLEMDAAVAQREGRL